MSTETSFFIIPLTFSCHSVFKLGFSRNFHIATSECSFDVISIFRFNPLLIPAPEFAYQVFAVNYF